MTSGNTTPAARSDTTTPHPGSGGPPSMAGWQHLALDAFFDAVRTGRTAAGRDSLARETAAHPGDSMDPALLGEQLLAFTRRPDVIDVVAFCRLALDGLPEELRPGRAVRRSLLRDLCLSTAIGCDAQGWVGRAGWSLLQAARADISVLALRDARRILRRALSGTDSPRNQALRAELARIFGLFGEHRVRANVVGSLAISIHARRFVKQHEDVDLVLPTDDDTLRGTALLTDELQYRVTTAYDWTAHTGELARLRKLESPDGMRVDLAYLPHWPVVRSRSFLVERARVDAVDLPELRHTYGVFLIENESTAEGPKETGKSAVLAIDRLLGLPPTVGFVPVPGQRLPPSLAERLARTGDR